MDYNWYYDEFSQVGIDYNNLKDVKEYDEKMNSVREINKEITDIINMTDINTDRNINILEVGTGTGKFAVEIDDFCNKVYAVDVSETMIKFAKERAKNRKKDNVYFYHAGFLSYDHTGEPLDLIISQLALHHLPDFWKGIALKNMYQMLKKDGKVYIHDVIYSFPINNYEKALNDWIEKQRKNSGNEVAKEIEIHIKNEFSTFNDIMEKLFKKVDFKIEKTINKNRFFSTYVLRK